jgi:hypothetical protein
VIGYGNGTRTFFFSIISKKKLSVKPISLNIAGKTNKNVQFEK